MNVEVSAILNESPTRVFEWANAIKYNKELTAEDKEISAAMDAWAAELGRTGFDKDHEISQMINKTFNLDAVSAPSELIDRMFNYSSIGEFDDASVEKEPENTFAVYDGMFGGNVDRSYIDSKVLAPTWRHLQVETDVSLVDIRRGGFKTIANILTMINEAMENKKVGLIIDMLDQAITNGSANYIAEATAAPTETSASALALYLADMTDGQTPVIFGQNKYIHAINKLAGSTTFASETAKDMYRLTGFIHEYQGAELFGVSGQKKLGDGSALLPNQRVFGAAGKIGDCITRGSINTYQETDINAEKIHVKVNGYQFGVAIADVDKAAKIVMAQ